MSFESEYNIDNQIIDFDFGTPLLQDWMYEDDQKKELSYDEDFSSQSTMTLNATPIIELPKKVVKVH